MEHEKSKSSIRTIFKIVIILLEIGLAELISRIFFNASELAYFIIMVIVLVIMYPINKTVEKKLI